MATKESKELVKKEADTPMVGLRDMERWFEDVFRRPFSLFGHPFPRFSQAEEIVPSIDILKDKDDIVVKAELPGVKKEDIDVTLTEDTITISGEKKNEQEVKKKDYYHYESSYGSFSRTFNLPAKVQSDKAKTKIKDGILEIRIPKTEEAKKKEVKVKVE
ncbi:MAG TPA: Hsp20/alpha crystallin family protein [Syntrophorhabdaceae bacterium]|nr:Hsp20/alpha crystallin family protein [Syntrophorhabdaceae bacterium]